MMITMVMIIITIIIIIIVLYCVLLLSRVALVRSVAGYNRQTFP